MATAQFPLLPLTEIRTKLMAEVASTPTENGRSSAAALRAASSNLGVSILAAELITLVEDITEEDFWS